MDAAINNGKIVEFQGNYRPNENWQIISNDINAWNWRDVKYRIKLPENINIYKYQDSDEFRAALQLAYEKNYIEIEYRWVDLTSQTGWILLENESPKWNWGKVEYRAKKKIVQPIDIYTMGISEEFKKEFQRAMDNKEFDSLWWESKDGIVFTMETRFSPDLSKWAWENIKSFCAIKRKIENKSAPEPKINNVINIYKFMPTQEYFNAVKSSWEADKNISLQVSSKCFYTPIWQNVDGLPYWDTNCYYRAVKKEYKPFTMETFPKGEVWVRNEIPSERLVTEIRANGVFCSTYFYLYQKLTNMEISLDGRTTWVKGGQKI